MTESVIFLNEIPKPALWTGILLTVLFLLFAYYRFSIPARWFTRLSLLLLRVVFTALLIFIILDPYWNRIEGKEWVGLLIDSSNSMSVPDAPADLTRSEAWKQYLKSGTLWKVVEKERWKKIMSVDESLEDILNIEELEASGESSRLMTAVQIVNSGYRADRDLLGWVLVSDGSATDYPEEINDWPQDLFFPWITVGMGKSSEVSNIMLHASKHQQHFFVNEIGELELRWDSTMPYDEKCLLKIMIGGKIYQERTITCADESYRTDISISEEGIHPIDVELTPTGWEGSVADNKVRSWINVTPRVIKVFYSESYYKDKNDFKLALEEDADFSVDFASSLIGFSRKNSVPFIKDPLHGLPQTKEGIFAYDAVILSDVKRNLLSSDQIKWISALVEEQGGALIMVGGVDSFGDGGYVRTQIEKMLPVEISEEYKKDIYLAARGTVENPFRAVVTPETQDHPILRIADDKDANTMLWRSMPLLGGYNFVGRLKPGAQLVLQHPTDISSFGPRVILAVQNYGKGKVLAFTSDITFNWGQWFLDWWTEEEGWLFGKFWRGAVKWLTEKRLRKSVLPLQMIISPTPPEAGLPVQIKIETPLDEYEGSSLEFSIKQNGKIMGNRRFDFISEAELAWGVPALAEGDYVLSAVWKKSSLPPVIQEMRFTVHPSRSEARNLNADPDFLRELAYKSGGEYIHYSEIGKLDEVFKKIRKQHLKQRSSPFWNQSWLYMLLLAILFTDWFIRKKKGIE